MTAATRNDATLERDEAREISSTRVFDAPRELVWAMWTEPEHIKQWWGPNGFTTTTHEMDVRPGGQWRFIMHGPDGTDYPNEITYNEVVPPSFLQYSHGPAPRFEVFVNFIDEGSKTRLEMRSVFHSATVRNLVVEKYNAVEGMHQTLGRLGEHLAAQSVFTISRELDAPRDLVFKVWTEKEHLEHWWGPKGITIVGLTNDPRPGGVMHYGMRSPDGEVMWGRWVYREITPPERLVWVNSFSDEQGGLGRAPFVPTFPAEILSTATFEDLSGRTRITLTWVPINANEEERAFFEGMTESMNAGWTGTFEQLASYLRGLK